MREITITLTEQDLLETTGRTLEEITDVNGYQTVVPLTEAELPAKVEKTYENPITKETETVMDYPDGTVFTKPNPETRTAFLAKRLAAAGMRVLSEPLRKQAIRNAELEANELFDGSISALVDRAKIVTIE